MNHPLWQVFGIGLLGSLVGLVLYKFLRSIWGRHK
jgi:hypothetical protein